MSEYLKKPYEISLWDEKKMWVRQELTLVEDMNEEKYCPGKFYSLEAMNAGIAPYVLDYKKYDKDKNYYEHVSGKRADIKARAEDLENWEGVPSVVSHFFKEQKICVIGSDLMDTPIRAIDPKLTSNVNGSNTLNFSIYSKYWDNESEQFFDNPFVKLLVNERKIKLRYGAINSKDCKWYDLIIKGVQENSETKVFQYTAKDQFVNELSKTGFDIILDAELENNMGNITTLADIVLEGSDWKIGKDSSILNQTREEPLYKITLNKEIIAKDMKDDSYQTVIHANSVIYGFYNVITNKEPYFQFLYVDGAYEIDDDRVIINSRNLYIDGVTYNNEGKPEFAESMNFSSEYRGKRLVRQAQSIYDATINKYVYVYEDDNKNKIYGYTESEYLSPKTVTNYITSPNSYISTAGWGAGGVKDGETTKYPKLGVQGFPDLRDVEDINDTIFKSLLQFTPEIEGQTLFNSGIMDHRSQINGFAEGEEYIFRIKYAFAELNEAGRVKDLTYTFNIPDVKIGFYELKDGVYSIKETLFDTANGVKEETDNEGYSSIRIKCSHSVSYSDMLKNRIGIFINLSPVPSNYPSKSYFLEDVQFFKYVTYEKEKVNETGKPTGEFVTLMAIPGGELISSVKTKYYYYYPSKEYKDIGDIKFVYTGYKPQAYTQVFNDDQYEKVRSINSRESNRFNLIQTLCEIFECWPKFTIEHNPETGEILLDENDGYRQKKWLTFHEYVGKNNHAGFKYGINLKSIQRNLESDEIVSKIVVKDNSNEFAKNGFCSIARAEENYPGENFIYDFSYYIQQGLLNSNEVDNDLYLDTNGYIGYYKKLRTINKTREPWIEEQAGLAADIPNFESSCQIYDTSVKSASEELDVTQQDIFNLTGYYYDNLVVLTKEIEKLPESSWNDDQKAIMNWWKRDDLTAKINKLVQLKNIITQHGALYKKAKEDLNAAQKRYDELEELIKNLATEKRALNLQFYKKYSRFIQEGSWIKEDYVDENLYYLDAESTLRTSAQPKVSYTINVLEISHLPDYENYKFQLGDKTYMEDTEFFGWTYKDHIKSPYQEEIVVTEIINYLDDPSQNAIRVQNYKTQFEDLFQRIAATTQSVTYHTGEYTRAAGIVETNGTISSETLQNSIDNNALRLENSEDQSVVWDKTGITTTSLSNTSEIVRMVSGGIFMSNDGGVTWRTGITGNGINANYITTGQLNTGKINIMNGDVPSFRWDGFGLNAYQFTINKSTNKPEYYNPSKFVRFDQYGIYGISGTEIFNPLIETEGLFGEDKIWKEANFALTWKGFMLKNNNGSVRISSDQDIQVLEGELERIKIGRLGGNVYGIRIKNGANDTVMETNSQGTLWLRNEMWVGMAETKDDSADMVAKIGYLSNTRKYIDENGNEVDTGKHEIIHASSEEADQAFIVYEDGRMIASAAEFTRGCKIGNLTIGEVEDGIDSTRKLDIQSKLGYNFKVEDAMPNPSQLELEAMVFGFTMAENAKVTWYGSTDFSTWTPIITGLSGEANEKFVLTYEDFKNKQKESIYYLKAIARSEQGEDYENYATIMAIAASDLRLIITSSSGNYFKNGIGATVLTAKLFKGGQEIDAVNEEGVYEYTYTWTSDDAEWKEYGKSIFIEAKDVNSKRTYVCDISKGGN